MNERRKQIEKRLQGKIEEARKQYDLVGTKFEIANEKIKETVKSLKREIDYNAPVYLNYIIAPAGCILREIVEGTEKKLDRIESEAQRPYKETKDIAERILKNLDDTFGASEEPISDENNRIGCINNRQYCVVGRDSMGRGYYQDYEDYVYNHPSFGKINETNFFEPTQLYEFIQNIANEEEIKSFYNRRMDRNSFETLILKIFKKNEEMRPYIEELRNTPYRPIQCPVKPPYEVIELTEEWKD